MSRKWFRFLLLLSWVIGAAGTTLFFIERRSLPPALRYYPHSGPDAPVTAWEFFLLGYVFLVLLVSVVNTVGLYKFKPWGRALYLWSLVVCYVTAPFLSPEAAVTTRLSYVFSCLYTALGGFILALLYFSPVARHFEREPSV